MPGYYAADGNAAESSADAATAGTSIRARRSGRVDVDRFVSHGSRRGNFRRTHGGRRRPHSTAPAGTLTIGPADAASAGLPRQGRLQYVGQRYLRFAEIGKYFLKSGADSPENLLAFADFDGTKPTHRYGPHELDAREGDPTWQGGRGRNLLGPPTTWPPRESTRSTFCQ